MAKDKQHDREDYENQRRGRTSQTTRSARTWLKDLQGRDTIGTERVSRAAGVGRLKKGVKDGTGVQSGGLKPAYEEELSIRLGEAVQQRQP